MGVTVTEAPPDPKGEERYMFRATAGQGHKVGWAGSEEEALRRGKAALRHLEAVEVHDPDELATSEASDGHTVLRAPDGTLGEVPDAFVGALLAQGYAEVGGDAIPQRTNEQSGPVEVADRPRRRGSRASRPADVADSEPVDEM